METATPAANSARMPGAALSPAFSANPATTTDLIAVKAKQRDTWSSGDYAVVGTTLQIVGENLCEALDLRAGTRVLDVAAGNGNATLAAARRWCDVTSTDYVAALLEGGRRRAQADGLSVRFLEADAENLPYPDASFDVVMSTFGVMFTADQERAAAQMARVCRSGGKIGLANWTPEGFTGQVFKTIGKYVPPAPGVSSPALWGTELHLQTLFGTDAKSITTRHREFVFRYRSASHFLEVFRTYYGPMHKAYLALDSEKQAAMTQELRGLMDRFNRSGDETMVVPSEYIEVVIERK
jgi:ubiquinone/menaquinone biosynthesis C-methylase UbiE